EGLLKQNRIVYICTNAMFMRKKMREWLAAELRSAENASPARTRLRSDLLAKLDLLVSRGLVSEKDADAIRNPKPETNGAKAPKPTIGPSQWMYWNVHLDGLERTHDLIVEREGVFKECILAIKMAKVL